MFILYKYCQPIYTWMLESVQQVSYEIFNLQIQVIKIYHIPDMNNY